MARDRKVVVGSAWMGETLHLSRERRMVPTFRGKMGTNELQNT
jgi:hypothetical protein